MPRILESQLLLAYCMAFGLLHGSFGLGLAFALGNGTTAAWAAGAPAAWATGAAATLTEGPSEAMLSASARRRSAGEINRGPKSEEYGCGGGKTGGAPALLGASMSAHTKLHNIRLAESKHDMEKE